MEEEAARADKTLEMFRQYLPSKALRTVLEDNFDVGTETIFTALQVRQYTVVY